MSVGVLGTGTALPPRIVGNIEVGGWCETDREWIHERTGVITRRYAEPGQTTSDLAAEAARNALANLALSPDQVHALVVATSTPDKPLPATAAHVQNLLGLNGIPAFDVNAVCCGYLYALIAATGLLPEHDDSAVALVIGADTYSRIMNRRDRKTVPLFGDGAGATVIGRTPDRYGLLGYSLTSAGDLAEYVQVPAGGSARPIDEAALDEGLDRFVMNGRAVKEYAMTTVPKTVQQACDQAGVTVGEIDRFVLHQGNVRLVEALADEMGVPREKVVISGDRIGNTAAASVPMTLGLEHERAPIQRGEVVLLAAIGGGMTTGAAVLRWY
ncbi:3-oxoacyl-ACP synthase III family protein [Nocardia sp. NPDC004068]|uniref:3-oxoacyl-ACP synthase III family protein n=1 Tax=Nocardia sp. NPDC004068 TaxID=3364303 RepID=UPI0036B4D0C7